MGGSNAAPGDKGLARGQSMVDPKTSAERHGMLFAAATNDGATATAKGRWRASAGC